MTSFLEAAEARAETNGLTGWAGQPRLFAGGIDELQAGDTVTVYSNVRNDPTCQWGQQVRLVFLFKFYDILL